MMLNLPDLSELSNSANLSNFSKLSKLQSLPSLAAQGNSSAVPPHMAQALALVRSGRLQEATALLMGQSQPSEETVSQVPLTQQSPQQSTHQTTQQPAHSSPPTQRSRPVPHAQRFQNPAAWGGAGVEDVLNNLEARTKKVSPASADPTSQQPATATLPTANEPGRFQRMAFKHHGTSHPYHLYTPQTPAPAGGRPLVLMLHGCTQDAANFARGTRMNALAETAGALVLYPTQSPSANPNGCWNWFRPEDQHAGTGEPALLLAMVRHAMAAHVVNPQRVYVAGLSAGGAMAAVLAQQYPQVFAAVGVHSGLAAGAAQTTLGALSAMKSGAKGLKAQGTRGGGRAVPMIVLHGDADTTVHQRNGEQLLHSVAASTSASAGAKANAAATVQTQEQGTSADGQRYTRTCIIDTAAQQSGAGPAAVLAEHWLLHGAGHAWSGGDARGTYANPHGVDASAEMLRFFLTHWAQGSATHHANPRPQSAGPTA